MTDEINVKFGGEVSGLQGICNQAASAIEAMTGNARAHLKGMEDGFASLTRVAIGVGAVLAVGSIMKKVVDETIKWEGESAKLARALGVTTDEATAIKVAVDDLNAVQPGLEISTDELVKAQSALSRALGTNEQMFKANGIVVRDSNGHYLSAIDIMFNVNDKLSQMKEGTDRNMLAQQLYGRSWKEIQGILALSREKLEEARQKVEQLHMTLGPTGQAEMRKYRAGLNDLNDMWTGFKITLSEFVLPIMNDIVDMFATIAPASIEIIKAALGGLLLVIEGLMNGFYTLYQVAKASMESIASVATAMKNSLVKISKGDFKGVMTEFAESGQRIAASWAQSFDKIADHSEKSMQRMKGVFDSMIRPMIDDMTGTDSKPKGGGGGGDKKDSSGSMDVYVDPKQALALEEAEIDARRKGALGAIEIEQEKVRELAELHIVEKEDAIRAIMQLENQRTQVELNALQERKAAMEKYGADPADVKKVSGQIEEEMHRHAMTVRKINFEMTQEVLKSWDQMLGAIENSMTSSVQKMVKGQMTFKTMMKNIWESILNEFIAIQMKMLFNHIRAEMAKTVSTETGVATRTAAEEAGAEESLLIKAATCVKEILMAAWVAAANVYQAIAAIPFIGPFLAPVMAIGAAALVAGYVRNIASAAGGWEVPEDQMAMVHKNEMILPSHLSDRIRNMTEPNNGGGNVTYSPQVYALDGKSVERVLKKHAHVVSDIIRGQARNFTPMPSNV